MGWEEEIPLRFHWKEMPFSSLFLSLWSLMLQNKPPQKSVVWNNHAQRFWGSGIQMEHNGMADLHTIWGLSCGWLDSWELGYLEAYSLTRQEADTGCQLEHLHVASPCGLSVWASLGWPRWLGSKSKDPKRTKQKHMACLWSCHKSHIVWLLSCSVDRDSHKDLPRFRRRG